MPTRTPPSTVAFGAGDAVTDRTFARYGRPVTPTGAWFVEGLAAVLAAAGYEPQDEPGSDVQVVLHSVDGGAPRPNRRQTAPTFVVAIISVPGPVSDVLKAGYPMLVRALANLAVLITEDGAAAHFVTLEQGTYTVERHDGDDAAFFAAVLARVEPLASSRLVIANEFRPDLEPELWSGDAETAQLARAGERLAELDLLPSVFPVEDILSERDLRHVKLLFGLGGLSYGNVSARRQPPTDSGWGPEFWMSASGVDKSRLRQVGREVLLVRGYDSVRDAMILAVPPDVDPNRVSVDAIEHWMIYQEHPDVGAVLHVHAWIPGTPATEINYPCGTLELARSVAELVRQAADPSRAVVGQRNHGLTITGHDVDEIFERIEGRVVRSIPKD
jgi:ribulose-5-phosphate 4-epimerase/fuculose-1-phosphate aldolase